MMLLYYSLLAHSIILAFSFYLVHATYSSMSMLPSHDPSSCIQPQLPFFYLDKINITYAAAESEAAELSSVLSCPSIAVLLWQQQDKGHSQRQMVEAVDVGVVPLLE